MNSQDQIFESYVPVYDVVPEKWEEARQFLVEHLKKISNAVNVREIGFFLDEELLSGKQFIPTAAMSGSNSSNSQQFRSILRKVIDFGALPNAATKNVAHGITFDTNFTLMQLYGAATAPGTLTAIPLPYASNIANEPITLFLTSTNVVVRTGINYSSYTRTFIVIEYIQEI